MYISKKYSVSGASSFSEVDSAGELTEPILEFFRDAGADFFTRENAGSSLLQILASTKIAIGFYAKEESEGIVPRFIFLMNLGLDPMAEDLQQRTSLDVAAAACGSEHILKLFKQNPME